MITIKITHHCLDLDIQLPLSGINMIYGDSGAGKSTLLKCIAGVEKPRIAKIALGDRTLVDTQCNLDIPAYQRNIGYLLQGAQLFPHLTVKNNLRYAEKRAKKLKTPNNEKIIDMAEAIRFFSLTEFLNHYPHQLSSGEQQRAAIARVLLSHPRLLLFDESSTGLDNPTQGKILTYIQHIHQNYNIPVIFVTHAIQDMVAAANHILILAAGKAVAQGDFGSIITQPAFTRLMGDTRLLEGKVSAHHPLEGQSVIAWNNTYLTVPQLSAPIGSTVRLWQYYSNKRL